MVDICPSPQGIRQIADDLVARYCAALDEGRLDDWCDLFADAASYRILSRENVAQSLPGAVLSLETRAAILDRIAALQQTAVYNIHYSRHLYSGVRASATQNGVIEFNANIAVYQTDQDGHTRLFCTGEIQGSLSGDPSAAIQQLTVVIDTFAVPTLLAVPI